MALLPKFDTPARLRDVPAGSPFYDQWHQHVAGTIRAHTPGDNGGGFYDPTETDVTVAGKKEIPWMGFPRDTIVPNRDNRQPAYILGDADLLRRDAQNEYFEWYVHRDATGKITKVTFVTEFRDYYKELWSVDRAAVVDIYRNLVDPAVQEQDLYISPNNQNYDIHNRWNTTDGIVHYIQTINTLGALVGLAQQSVTSPLPNSNNYEATPRYANADTSVDPRASYDVHMLVRKRLQVTLKDPVGIYIAQWDNSGITQPNGQPAPRNWWKIRRGSPGMVLRLEYEVPSNLPFEVGDLKLGGRPIEYGGQLAEQITVFTTGTAGTSGR